MIKSTTSIWLSIPFRLFFLSAFYPLQLRAQYVIHHNKKVCKNGFRPLHAYYSIQLNLLQDGTTTTTKKESNYFVCLLACVCVYVCDARNNYFVINSMPYISSQPFRCSVSLVLYASAAIYSTIQSEKRNFYENKSNNNNNNNEN